MRQPLTRSALPLLLLLWVAACSERVSTDPVEQVPADAAVVQLSATATLQCDLTRQMSADVRDYFSNPERRDAQATMRDLASACGSNDAPATEAAALALLRMVDGAFNAGTGGAGAVGSRLVNALLACTTDAGCTQSASPGLDLVGPMNSIWGMLRVSAWDEGGAWTARGAIPFDHEEDDGLKRYGALFGVELSAGKTWQDAIAGEQIVLLYGDRIAPSSGETLLGEWGFDMNVWPDNGPFSGDNIVNVGVCFVDGQGASADIGVPHDGTGGHLAPRMQREQGLLQIWKPGFCENLGSGVQQASLIGSMIDFTKSMMASAGMIALTDTRTPSIGGAAIDFSPFAPVAADRNGILTMTEPKPVVAVGESIGVIEIEATTGEGTPVEVAVQLYVYNNSGTPAGAIVSHGPATTSEGDGTITIVDAKIHKPGGYIICVRAVDPTSPYEDVPDVTFTEACSSLFHVRN